MKRYHSIFEKIKSIQKIGIYSLFALMMVVVTPSSAFASTVYTSFQSTSANSHGVPGQMTMANGSFWYMENPAGSLYNHYIGNMTTSGSVAADYDLAAGNPSKANLTINSITTGPDGNIWFVGGVSTTTVVGSLNTTTGAVTYYSQPSSTGWSNRTNIVVGSDGNLWYAVKGAGGAMDGTCFVSVNPTTGVSTATNNNDYYANVGSIASGPDGALWYTDAYYNRVSSFVVGGHGSGRSINLPASSYPSQIIAGLDGNMWLVEGGKIAKMTMSGVLTGYALPTGVNVDPYTALNSGADGAIWFNATVNNSTYKIGRVSLTGHVTTYALPVVVSKVNSVLYGPDDALWFTANSNNTGYLERLGYY